MSKDNDITLYQGNLPALPAQTSRRTEIEFVRQVERILATAEIGMAGMSQMSEVERHAQWKLATTAAAMDMLARGAAATRSLIPAEKAGQQALFESYARHMAQLAEITNITIIKEVDLAIEQLGKRSFADVLEDFDARLNDAILGRPGRPALLKGGR